MTTEGKGSSIKRTARVAGLLYLAHIVTFFIADNGVHSTAVGSIDLAATAQGFAGAGGLFRVGFVSFLLTAIFFFLAAWALYVVLKPVHEDLALLFLLLNLGGVAIWCSSQVFEFAALLLVDGAETLGAIRAEQRQALAMLFLSLYQTGFMIANLVLNLWLFPLGYLVFKSGFLPRVLGILLLIDGFAMFVWFFQFFFLPNYEVVGSLCLGAGLVAEGLFCLWLIIKGVNVERWEQRALGAV